METKGVNAPLLTCVVTIVTIFSATWHSCHHPELCLRFVTFFKLADV